MTNTTRREAPLCAANIAALMFAVAACSALMLPRVWRIAMSYEGATKQNLMWAVVAGGIAVGLFARRKWAWWLAMPISAVVGVSALLTTPPPVSAIGPKLWNPPDPGFIALSVVMASGGLAMLIAFIALLSKSTRRSFGITKAT